MAEAPKVKRNRIIDRSYDDANGKVELSVGEDSVAAVEASEVHPEMLIKLVIRKIGEVVGAAYMAALNAEGGTAEKAMEAVAETIKALQENTLTLRQGAGEGLSVEDEKALMVAAVVHLGYFANETDAKAKIEEVYAVTETRKRKDGKEYTVHPQYTTLKRDKDIAAYIASNSGADTKAKAKTTSILGVAKPTA